jgi:hypothetical protein
MLESKMDYLKTSAILKINNNSITIGTIKIGFNKTIAIYKVKNIIKFETLSSIDENMLKSS